MIACRLSGLNFAGVKNSPNSVESKMIDRRRLLSGIAAFSPLASLPIHAGEMASVSGPPRISAAIARYVHDAKAEDLPGPVKKEVIRTFLNWVGVTIGGSQHEAVDRVINAFTPFFGQPEATVFGRKLRCDALHAALINGVGSHVLDFDDTHLRTIIHPAGPVASAIFALSERYPVSGRDFLHALALGIEVECRIGNAIYPSHYDAGWHITGSCGVFGSAMAVGRLLGLDQQQLLWALGIAASQPVGLKAQFGSMTKSFHIGRAAQNGLVSGLLAKQGFTADDAAIEGKDGFAQATAKSVRWEEVTEGLGSRYESASNTYKPFPCGIVTHPAIDAAIRIRKEFHPAMDQVKSIELSANPLVMSLTGKLDPSSGLESKFSISHCIAVGLTFGFVSEKHFQNNIVLDPMIRHLRALVRVKTDATVNTHQCDLRIQLQDGRVLETHVEHVLGSLENPLSDDALEAKAYELSEAVLGPRRAKQLLQRCWQLDSEPTMTAFARLIQLG